LSTKRAAPATDPSARRRRCGLVGVEIAFKFLYLTKAQKSSGDIRKIKIHKIFPKSFFPNSLLTHCCPVLHSLANPGVQILRRSGLREIETMAKPPKEVTRWLATAQGGSLEALGQVL
jgi:hypothetical protein